MFCDFLKISFHTKLCIKWYIVTMDYVVGNVAALISGNVTPNRPKLSKRALTPIKHVPSPNVTPKSELVDDRSIFLSPSVQKKKAIVKKSPKRIFQNPDLDVTNENDGNITNNSPKAEKVKKHLKGELEASVSPKNNAMAAKSPENTPSKKEPKKKAVDHDDSTGNNISTNELTPKMKKKRNSVTNLSQSTESLELPKKIKKQNVDNSDNVQNETRTITNVNLSVDVKASKKKKRNKNKPQIVESEQSEKPKDDVNSENIETVVTSLKKKNEKRKKPVPDILQENDNQEDDSEPTKNKKVKVNPNAVTDKDSDSEHESDNEIESEKEENNKEVLENSVDAEPSSDEEETPAPKTKQKEGTEQTEKVKEINTEEEIKRTLFVGNVPFSKKCKKEIKKIFSKYGEIESVRIRTVPVKDPSVTPKLAVIKQELHPERSTVNVYVKFTHPQCVEQALAENNTVLNNNHLRVTRSGSTGAAHDPRHAVFVGNIPFALEDEGLRDKFQACGDIESVRIVRDKKTNAGKGFGYVNFTSRDGVELALALTDEDLTIKNRILRVKRCTQATQRQAKGPNRVGQGNKVSQGDRQRNQSGNPFNQGKGFNQGDRFQDNRRGGFQGSRRGNSFRGSRGGNSFQGRGGGNFQGRGGGNFQGRGGSNFQGRGASFRGRGGSFRGRGGSNVGRQNDDEQQDGAYRRLMHKRKSQEGGEGPPSKVARDDPPREKKARKEFVGITAEKKKKRKFDKGQKKKKALSEILTK